MFEITQLITYPIKGMGGVALQEADLTNTGIQYDRQFMLVDNQGVFISQRSDPKLSKFKLFISSQGLKVAHEGQSVSFAPQLVFSGNETTTVKIFDHSMQAQTAFPALNQWFTNALGKSVRLVQKAENRYVKNHPGTEINFPDSSQYLFLSESAMTQLNEKMNLDLNINRFRANVIFKGSLPHAEDTFRKVKVGAADFEFVKPCGRCKVTTIDQETGEMGFEPLVTLSKYRKEGNSVQFGSYFKWIGGESTIRLGDQLIVGN